MAKSYWRYSTAGRLALGLIAFTAICAGAEWTKIGEWKGSGIKQTETFRTTAREVRISWATKATNPALRIFQIYLHREDGGLAEIAANSQEDGQDSTIARLTPGAYYLKINSGGRWIVVVEEKR